MTSRHIEWNRKFDLGIDIIDRQHRTIADCYNRLADAGQTSDRRAVERIIEGLIQYTVYHFDFEEAVLEQAGYRHLRAHQRIHGLFIRHLFDFAERYQEGEEVTAELGEMLKTWLFKHIEQEDGRYRDELGERILTVIDRVAGQHNLSGARITPPSLQPSADPPASAIPPASSVGAAKDAR